MSGDPRIPAHFTTIDEDLEVVEVLIARGNRFAASCPNNETREHRALVDRGLLRAATTGRRR